MRRSKHSLGPAMLLLAAVVVWGLTTATAAALAGPSGTQGQTGASTFGATSEPPDEYVGADTCMECHEDRAASYLATPHGRARDPRTPAAANGCETCHGPGRAHVEEGDPELIKRFSTMPAATVSDTCTTCHNRGEHAFWEGSQHDGRDLGCTTCHSVHEWGSEDAQLIRVTQVETCSQCHQDKAAKLQRTAHMPVREGKLECTSCHNPHGSANVRLLRVGFSVNDACTSCHAEKRGPFLWEHAPVQESCTSCHDPHGSSNDRLLVAKVPMLCQRCHAHTRHPARPYDAASVASAPQAYGRACVNCHQNLHGSNHPSGQFFLR